MEVKAHVIAVKAHICCIPVQMHPQNICACVFSILIAPSTATVKKTCMQIPPPPLWWMSRMITILACENNIDWEREREAKWKMR